MRAFLLAALVLLTLGPAQAQTTTDWHSAGTGSVSSDAGDATWDGTGNITVSDDLRAVSGTAFVLPTTQILRATDFGFTGAEIPEGASILGIEVEIEKHATTASGNAQDSVVRLRLSTGQVGDNKATATPWPSSDQYVPYGGDDDDWNASLSRSDVISEGFGVDLQATLASGLAAPVQVDHIRMRITHDGEFSAPENIDDLTAEGVSHVAVALSFTPSEGAVTHQYRHSLHEADAWSEALPIGNEGGTVTGLSPATEYDFQVRGVNPEGESEWSNTATAETLEKPVPKFLQSEGKLLTLGGALLRWDRPSYYFTLTAEAFDTPFGGVGYFAQSGIGEIDKPPIPGETLDWIISGAVNSVRFAGDLTELLDGKTVHVNGVAYPGTWSFNEDVTPVTLYTYDDAAPVFADQGAYFVEIE